MYRCWINAEYPTYQSAFIRVYNCNVDDVPWNPQMLITFVACKIVYKSY